MTAKEFIERYGLDVKVYERDRLINGHIVGYYKEDILIKINPNDTDHYLLRTTYKLLVHNGWHMVEKFYEQISFMIRRIIDIIPNINDDCLDCGAKDNEVCKDSCPNKEK